MSSDGLEHLSAVHNNPFIQRFGLPHHASTRQESMDNECSIPSSSASSEKGDDDGDQEYHVNSGFVNKLRSKFAQLENRGHRVTLSRKSASVENLLTLGSQSDTSYKGRRWLKDDSSVSNLEKVEMRKPAGYKPQIRPRSYDILESSGRMVYSRTQPALPQKKKEVEFLKQNHLRSVKPPLPKKSSIDTTATTSTKNMHYYRKSSSDSLVPKAEHHDWKVAPDLEKIGRDNIVIIEHKNASVPKDKVKVKSEVVEDADSGGYRQVKPIAEKNRVSDENELPKPNTVSNFRSLFEKPGKALKPLNAWRQVSPTRRTSSGNNSPSVASPRSPLMKVNDDNVFEGSSHVTIRYDHDKSVSPRNSANIDTNSSARNSSNIDTNYSPRNSSNIDTNYSQRNSSNIDTNFSPRNSSSLTDYTQNVDTNSTSMQKSFDLFNRRSSVDRETRKMKEETRSSENRSSVEMEQSPERPLSPNVQRALSPVHPLSNIFDSKSVSKDKPKHPKPKVMIKRKNSIPKDTIELKHDADRLISSQLNIEQKVEIEELPVVNDNVVGKSADEFRFEGVSNESTVKPSSKKSGKISPRKTKVFDSSNIVKKDKETPKTPTSPIENVPSFKDYNVPKQVKVSDNITEQARLNADNENETRVSVDVIPARPPRRTVESSTNGITELKPNIVANDKSENRPKPRVFKVREQNVVTPEIPTIVNDTERVKPTVKSDNNEQVVSGMSSFLASRLKKTQPDQDNQLKTSSVHLANGSSPSPVPRKRQAPSAPMSNGSVVEVEMETNKDAPPLPITPQPAALTNTNTGVVISRKKKPQTNTKMVFDSSKIATKRKEPPKRKPARKTLEQLNQNITFESDTPVPKLDLSSITEPSSTEYQEGYIPTIIKPCTIKFVGAEVTFENSPFKKQTRKGKVKKAKIAFNDHATTTFEYEDEESALEKYLMDHPEEREEAMRQEDEFNGVIVQPTEELLHDSPRAPPTEPEVSMKSNTIIGSAGGALTSYKSKMQTQEFQFGMTPEPEPEYYTQDADNDTEDAFNLLPAEENENETFSAESGKADMLF